MVPPEGGAGWIRGVLGPTLAPPGGGCCVLFRFLGAHVRGWREGVRSQVRLRKGTAQRTRLFPHTPVCVSDVEPTRVYAHRGVWPEGE